MIKSRARAACVCVCHCRLMASFDLCVNNKARRVKTERNCWQSKSLRWSWASRNHMLLMFRNPSMLLRKVHILF